MTLDWEEACPCRRGGREGCGQEAAGRELPWACGAPSALALKLCCRCLRSLSTFEHRAWRFHLALGHANRVAGLGAGRCWKLAGPAVWAPGRSESLRRVQADKGAAQEAGERAARGQGRVRPPLPEAPGACRTRSNGDVCRVVNECRGGEERRWTKRGLWVWSQGTWR